VGPEPDVSAPVRATLLSHPDVRDVHLIGSRAAGTAGPLSDWDFAVETVDFARLANDLRDLTSRLEPLVQQWDRLSPHQCYMLVLAGPTKIDLLFLDQPHDLEPPWEARAETLTGIDDHFWDWALWLAAKDQAGKRELVRSELRKMDEHLLGPMGVREMPRSVEAAVSSYRAAREELESRFGVRVSRRLERVVLPALPRR
jgi:predicted nucleotidyltransferase